ncbi:hypothetical protein [Actinomadura coerulea]|uniref:hypothetical protein n=1 Tax=Actinomadura coerulea TaxID=46159 RepID=UPI0034415287
MTTSGPNTSPGTAPIWDLIGALFRGRRSAHQSLIGHAPTWFALREELGERMLMPPSLPAAAGAEPNERLKALAAEEAARLGDAELFAFDAAATSAAVSYGARLHASAAMADTAPDGTIAAPWIVPPTPAGFVRWATPITLPGNQSPITAVHWGRITTPETSGIWLVFWGDLSALLGDGLPDASAPPWLTPQLADDVLTHNGPLYYDAASFLQGPDNPHTRAPGSAGAHGSAAAFAFTDLRGLPLTTLPADQRDPNDALTYLVLASWAMLTPDPAQPAPPPHLTRHPVPVQEAEADRKAGLPPAHQVTQVTAPTLRPTDPLPPGLDDGVHHLRMRVYSMAAPDAPDGPTPDEVIADLLRRYEAEAVMMAAYRSSRQLLHAMADQDRTSRDTALAQILSVLTPTGQFPAEGMPFDGRAWTGLEHLLLPADLETTLPPPGIAPTDLLWALGTFQACALIALAGKKHHVSRPKHKTAPRPPTGKRRKNRRKKRR